VQRGRSDQFPSCEVCGRTLLKGEQLHEYVTPQEQRLGVCVLCRGRAEASGWILAEEYSSAAREPTSRGRRGQALRERFGRAAARARSTARASLGGARGEGDAEKRGDDGVAARASSAVSPPEQRPAGRPRQPSKRDAAPQPSMQPSARQSRRRRGPEAIMRHAVELFNSSEECRKVAGLIRSLGQPQAAVRPDPGRQIALVTVAWELSWYQWEVTDDSHREPVREVAKGTDLAELSEDARAWNAAVAEDGRLRLRGPSARRKPAARQA
jgi:hypothetical protein